MVPEAVGMTGRVWCCQNWARSLIYQRPISLLRGEASGGQKRHPRIEAVNGFDEISLRMEKV
jgi:hypothetical protein